MKITLKFEFRKFQYSMKIIIECIDRIKSQIRSIDEIDSSTNSSRRRRTRTTQQEEQIVARRDINEIIHDLSKQLLNK